MQTTTEMSFYPNFMATQPAPFVPGVWNGANPYYPQHPLYPNDAVNAPQQPQPGNAPPPRLLHEIRRAASSANPERTSVWDINDKRLPPVAVKDSFVLWPNGHCQFIYYRSDCGNVKKHGSGWAMRNTNNHNKYILKKSCLGVLVCSSEDCHVMLRPAICDKARKAQQGRECTRLGCEGRLMMQHCRGNGGYPVTHFWRLVNGDMYFQAKGFHDHARPDLKPLRRKSRRSSKKSTKENNQRNQPPTPTNSNFNEMFDNRVEMAGPSAATAAPYPHIPHAHERPVPAQFLQGLTGDPHYPAYPMQLPFKPEDLTNFEERHTGYLQGNSSGGNGSWSSSSTASAAEEFYNLQRMMAASWQQGMNPEYAHLNHQVLASTPMRSYECMQPLPPPPPPQPQRPVNPFFFAEPSMRSSAGESANTSSAAGSDRRLS